MSLLVRTVFANWVLTAILGTGLAGVLIYSQPLLVFGIDLAGIPVVVYALISTSIPALILTTSFSDCSRDGGVRSRCELGTLSVGVSEHSPVGWPVLRYSVQTAWWTPTVKAREDKATMTNEEQANYQLLLELGAAFNAHDLDKIMGHFAEDSSLDMPRGSQPWGTRFTGKDGVRKGLAMRFETTPDVHYGDDRHWVSGSMGVSEWLLTATTKDGRKLEVRGCDHYEFRGGKVIRKDSYWKIVE